MKLSFWSQALEEDAESVLLDEGRPLGPDDLDSAARVIERIRRVREAGTQCSEYAGVTVWQHRREFVVRFYSVQPDYLDRRSPLMAHGTCGSDGGSVEPMMDQVDDFLAEITRSVSRETQAELRAAFRLLKKSAAPDPTQEGESRFIYCCSEPGSQLFSLWYFCSRAKTPRPQRRRKRQRLMATRPLNENAYERVAIVVLTQPDLDRCDYDRDAGALLLDDSVHVLTPADLYQSRLGPRLASAGLIRPGAILVQNPYDTDDYADSLQASEFFGLQKHMLFCEVVQLLGGRSVTVHQIEKQERSSKTSVKVDVKVGVVATDGSVVSSELEKLANAVRITPSWEGGDPDLDAATAMLHRNHLYGDPVLRSLVAQRRISGNMLRTLKFVVDLSSECRRNLAVVAKLKVPMALKTQIGVKVERVHSDRSTYQLVVDVEF